MRYLAWGETPSELALWEGELREGERGKVEAYFDHRLSGEELSALEELLLEQGVHLVVPPRAQGEVLSLHFEKRLAPLIPIAIAIAAIAGLLGWQLFGSGEIAGVPLAVWLVAGTALTYYMFRPRPTTIVIGKESHR